MSSLREHRLALACGLIASLPIIAQALHAVVSGWQPLGDDAVIAVRALDALTVDQMLLGMPSFGASGVNREQIFHLGPLLFWTLALPARLPSPTALELAVGVLNVASVMGVAVLAERRGGRPLMFGVCLAIPVMLASLPAEALSDVWNPAAAQMPFLLLLFCTWSLACGEYRMLPLVVLTASFVVQCHLSFLLPVAGVVAVGLVGMIRAKGRPSRGWLVATVLVAFFCWSAPLIEQAIHRPGNLVRLGQAAGSGEPTLGPAAGIRAVARAVGVPPWWLRPERDALERATDLSTDPNVLTIGSAVLVIVGLAAIVLVARRGGRREIASAAAIGLVLCAALGLSAASGPRTAVLTLNYVLWWASPAGLFVWLALCWGALALLTRVRLPRRATAVALSLIALCAVAVTAGANRPEEPNDGMRAIAQRLEDRLPPSGVIRVDARSSKASRLLALDFQAGTVYALRRRGREVSTPLYASALGNRYKRPGPAAAAVHIYVDHPTPPQAQADERFKVPWVNGPVWVSVVIDPEGR